jgi:hypothetical protein
VHQVTPGDQPSRLRTLRKKSPRVPLRAEGKELSTEMALCGCILREIVEGIPSAVPVGPLLASIILGAK